MNCNQTAQSLLAPHIDAVLDAAYMSTPLTEITFLSASLPRLAALLNVHMASAMRTVGCFFFFSFFGFFMDTASAHHPAPQCPVGCDCHSSSLAALAFLCCVFHSPPEDRRYAAPRLPLLFHSAETLDRWRRAGELSAGPAKQQLHAHAVHAVCEDAPFPHNYFLGNDLMEGESCYSFFFFFHDQHFHVFCETTITRYYYAHFFPRSHRLPRVVPRVHRLFLLLAGHVDVAVQAIFPHDELCQRGARAEAASRGLGVSGWNKTGPLIGVL